MKHVKQLHSQSDQPEASCTGDQSHTELEDFVANINENISEVQIERQTDGCGIDSVSNVENATVEPVPASKEFSEAMFIMSLRAQKVTSGVISSVVANTEVLVQSCLQDFVSKLIEEASKKGLNLDGIDLPKLIEESSANFSKVKTTWLQDSYFREHMGVVEPKKISLVQSEVVQDQGTTKGVNRPTHLQQHSFYYVSLVDLLKCLYLNENFCELLQPLLKSEYDVLRGCFHGLLFQSNPFFCDNPDAIAVVLDFDEVNLVDTVSSRPRKMGMFYFSVLNVKDEVRSRLTSIYLLMAVDSILLDTYGIDEFLKPVVADLKRLQEGVQLPDGNILFGTLLAIMGDNLAIHLLAGLKLGFVAYRPCRYCKMILQDVRCKCTEDESALRTPEEYNEQVEVLKQFKSQDEKWQSLSKEFGVRSGSVLNSLSDYHVIGGAPPDIFHDLIEGCVALTVHLLLSHYCTGPDKIVSLSYVNARLVEFDYGYSETRPSTILPQHLKENANLHQNGSQMWSLANILPLILEPLISVDDRYWENYVCLLEITGLVFSRSIPRGVVGYLAYRIEDYLSSFQELYSRPLTPKQHFLVHYPRLILQHGPLGTYNTIRFEGKHQYFIDLMKKFKCFKNPSLTMAKQHQINQAYELSGKVDQFQYGLISQASSTSLPYRHILPAGTADSVQTVAHFIARGVKYVPKKCLILVSFQDDLPEFGFLESILFNNGNPIFIYSHMETICFDVFKNMYKVRVRESFGVIAYSDLQVYDVFHKHEIVEGSFVIVKRAFSNLW